MSIFKVNYDLSHIESETVKGNLQYQTHTIMGTFFFILVLLHLAAGFGYIMYKLSSKNK